MRLKDLFTVPAGQKVTEKHLRRVLISSICSILLCMSCLVSATWAWFAVSIENTGNEIWIGEPEIYVTVGGAEYVSGTELSDPDITLRMVHANETDVFDKKSALYVTLNIQSNGGTKTECITLDEGNNYSKEIIIENSTGQPCSFSWVVSWFVPPNAAVLTENTVTLVDEEPTQSSAQTTTEGTAESTTEASTQATTEPSSAATTETTESATTPSEAETTSAAAGES